MSKLKKAVELSFEEWNREFDKRFDEAMARGEIPIMSDEEMSARAKEIWRKAHSESKE